MASAAAGSPHDGHHAHECVGRAAGRALAGHEAPVVWLTWGLWADLPVPNVLLPFGEARMAVLEAALAAHAGELDRSRYDVLLRARAQATAVLGPERVHGFGAPGLAAPFAEVLMAFVRVGEGWRLAEPATVEPGAPFVLRPSARPADAWLRSPSPRAVLRGKA